MSRLALFARPYPRRMAKKGRALAQAPPPNQVASVVGTRLSSD
jgi:hypothetical protein